VYAVVKPEWGTKRVCLSCGAKFYDMQRDPIACPACQTPLDPGSQSKPRRARAAPKLATVVAASTEFKPEIVVGDEVEIDAEVALEDDEAEEVVVADEADDEAEDDGESAIEDVSELGDDDMADVIDADIEEDEAER
jgi:uncharacterized protein (TIGR02300 family)